MFKGICVDVDEIRANLIKMRKYIIFHQIGIGECCAWNRLKEAFGVGQTTDEADWAWLDAYEKLQAMGGGGRNDKKPEEI